MFTPNPILKSEWLLPAISLLSMFLFSSCKAPIITPGVGQYLRIDITEQETGRISFYQTNSINSSGEFQMECEFQDGSVLRSFCDASLSLDCPIVTLTPEEAAKLTTTSRSLQVYDFPKQSIKLSRVYVGYYKPIKPTPGSTTSYRAAFPTKSLPIKIRVLGGGKLLKEITPILKLVVYASPA